MLLGVIWPLRAAPEGVYSSPPLPPLAVAWLGTHNALPTPLVSAAPVHQWDLGMWLDVPAAPPSYLWCSWLFSYIEGAWTPQP